jgi:16S rRNA C967 or C1407 C5-methylase (RsmB/RsmF family)
MTAAYAEPTCTTDLSAAPPAPTVALVELLHPVAADADQARSDRLAAAAQRRAAARTRDLSALLRERPDLAGVHAPADFAVDAVRWCA